MEGHAGTDVFVVLVAALKVFHVCSQMGVDDAEAGVVENKPHRHASFVPLKNMKHEEEQTGAFSKRRSECGVNKPFFP